MITEFANAGLKPSEKKHMLSEEGFSMLRLRSCPFCRHTRQLAFQNAANDHACPRCGNMENASDAGLMTQTLRGSKSDVVLPILVAISMAVVFALFVFWVAFGQISR